MRADVTVNGRRVLQQPMDLRDGALIRTPLGTLRYLAFFRDLQRNDHRNPVSLNPFTMGIDLRSAVNRIIQGWHCLCEVVKTESDG